MMNQHWTEEEHKRLVIAIEESPNEKVDWRIISEKVGSRTDKQCKSHHQKVIKDKKSESEYVCKRGGKLERDGFIKYIQKYRNMNKDSLVELELYALQYLIDSAESKGLSKVNDPPIVCEGSSLTSDYNPTQFDYSLYEKLQDQNVMETKTIS